jgi:hypothetical protein
MPRPVSGTVGLHIQEGHEMTEKVVQRYGQRVGYTETEVERFHEGGHRIRQVSRLSRAAAKYSIQAAVVNSKNCNSGHTVGQTFILEIQVVPRVKEGVKEEV